MNWPSHIFTSDTDDAMLTVAQPMKLAQMHRSSLNATLIILMMISVRASCLAAGPQQLPDPFELETRNSSASEPQTDGTETAPQPDALPPAIAPATPLEEQDLDEKIETPKDAKLFADKILPKPPLKELALKRIAWIEVEGPIFGQFHWYLLNRIKWARAQNPDAVVIDLTSPGGEMGMSIDLGRALANIDWATTICFVSEEAISGGAITALGADYIVMQDGSMIGDAGPIELRAGGVFEHAPEKIVSYLAPIMGELARQNGRPATLAEAMVDRSLKVYEAVESDGGQHVFISKSTLDGAPDRYQDAVLIAETGQNRFLTVAANRALELRLCENVVADQSAFEALLGPAEIIRTKLTGVDRTVYLLNRPWLTGLLLVVGLIGLYLEAAAPGISIAGLTAVLCFGIFFWSHALGGTAGVLEILLFVLGVGCIACEIFILPGFGIFGISGVGLVAVSLIMATQTFVIPETSADWRSLQLNTTAVLGAMLLVFVLGILQVLFFDSLPGLNFLQLQAPVDPPSTESAIQQPSLANTAAKQLEIAMGMSGIAESDLRPAGKISIHGQLADVVSEGDYIVKGTKVDVIRIEGNRITVRTASAS